MISRHLPHFMRAFSAALFICLIGVSCRKGIGESAPEINIPIDLTATVQSSISGFVTDENNAPVLAASVKAGTSSTTTDKFGYFEIKNADVVKNAAVVSVLKPGYFKSIKTYTAVQNKAAFFRIKLIPKQVAGSIDATAGGNVSLANGLKITFPAASLVNGGSGAAYSGQVQVVASWLNPAAADLNQTMPGDLRGIDANNNIKLLTTYGMAGVELTGTAGELLQVAPGKKVNLSFPLPGNLSATAPATIPLWYFDEVKGLWKEEGMATKSGNSYTGDVSHFTFWNCDEPQSYVQLECSVKLPSGAPLGFAGVRISEIENPENVRFGYTDSSGFVAGPVPENVPLKIEVFAGFDCSAPAYSTTITVTHDSSLSLIVANNAQFATINGSVTNCSGLPVANGYVLLQRGDYYTRYALDANGSYQLPYSLCSGPENIAIIGGNISDGQQSFPLAQTVVSGANSIPAIQACGITAERFFNASINSTYNTANYSFVSPVDSLFAIGPYTSPFTSTILVHAENASSVYWELKFSAENIAAGSSQPIIYFKNQDMNHQLPDSTTMSLPFNVNITEYSTEYISGNFSGTLTGFPTPHVYQVSCAFRVRRY